MRPISMTLVAVFAVCLGTAGFVWAAGAGNTLKKSPLDQVTVYQGSISKDTPVRIQRFGTENADLGTGAKKKKKAKYQEIAEEMKENAPKLTASGAIEELKERGFVDVAEVGEEDTLPDQYLLVRGEFTVLNPGSQGKRYFGGFAGAGKSQVCATGEVVNANDEVLMKFDHCRHESVGFYGGDSEGQMQKDSYATGSHFAEFMDNWAQGKYDY